MRAHLLAAGLLTAVLLLVPATAQSGPSSGVYVGTVGEGETDRLHYTTHGNNPCLAIYIPHTYVVTLASADTMRLTVGQHSDVTSNGVATLVFTANYCTAFTVLVEGLDIDHGGAYTVTVGHVIQTASPVIAGPPVLA